MSSKTENQRAELGDEVKDTVTGYTGIVIGVGSWLHGCVRVNVQAQALHEGKPVDGQWFDLGQVKVTRKAVLRPVSQEPAPAPAEPESVKQPRATGGPRPAPQRRSDA